MKPVGLVLALLGYTLVYFGYESIRGPGVGFLDLIIPGRPFTPYQGNNPNVPYTLGGGGTAPEGLMGSAPVITPANPTGH